MRNAISIIIAILLIVVLTVMYGAAFQRLTDLIENADCQTQEAG